MPAYDYKCPNCEQTKEVRHSIDDPPKVFCSQCGNQMERYFITSPLLKFRGSWFKTKGQY
jgi:putative FmdB family regulatory protein